ncbi:MAG: hypothetical protein K8F25_16085, partial [Fimbriimonadaceae bacterium]|nr:hypothetical protein [Alphaproteobacteria bacterium]
MIRDNKFPVAGRESSISGRHGFYVGRQGLYDPANEHDSCGVGFITKLDGTKSHKIVSDGLQILLNLTHRGAVGADPTAGDGAGMLVQIPHVFLSEECSKLGFELPEPGEYGVGFVFMPRNPESRDKIRQEI